MSMYNNERVNGFLRTDGVRIVNGAGEEIILRGWGAGNWMNPEGFMIGIGTQYMNRSMEPGCTLPLRYQSARSVTSTVREMCGSKYLEGFWKKWWESQLTEADIRAMAELGYNSVRLCLTAWALMPEEPELSFSEAGFAELERVLALCEKYRIYAIIDMHGAPGGQSGLACDDGIDNIPHMFLEPESRERTLVLWEEIARRCAGREIVAGYDLLNEPISIGRWHYLIPELRAFYDECIARMRKYDKNHIMFLEGPMFATNMRLFDRQYDLECGNWAISVHMYGYSPEIRDLYKFIAVRDRLNVPVWIGEGRNKDAEMAVFYEIAAQAHMGFNLWAWKSCVNGENSGGVQYELPEGAEKVNEFAMNGGARPSYAESQRIFDRILDAMRFENCHVNESAHIYCQRRQGITLPGAGYDWREGAFTANWRWGNALCYRTEDHTKLVLRPGCELFDKSFMPGGNPAEKNDPLVDLWLSLEDGAYAEYTVRDVTAPCNVKLRVRSEQGAILAAECDGRRVELEIAPGDEAMEYAALTLEPAEARTVRLTALNGTAEIAAVEFPR